MVKKATSCMLVWLLITGLFVNCPVVNAQTADPSQATISISGVPEGTSSLAVELTFDSAVVSISSVTGAPSGSLAVPGGNGVGVVDTSGSGLPASFDLTVNFSGVADGSSDLTIGNVANQIGGTAIEGASATSDVSSITVTTDGGSSSSSSSSSSSTGGALGGNLDNDTVTITLTGDALATTTALNVVLSFTDTSVAGLASDSPTVSGDGITQLLTSANTETNTVSAVFDGSPTGSITITAMLAAGETAGSTDIGVASVAGAGGVDLTGSVVATVDPTSVTNSASASGDCGTFTVIGPTNTLVAPGTAAVAVEVTNAGTNLDASINGSDVDFVGDGSRGVAIVDLPETGTALDLSLSATCSEGSATADLTSLTVTQSDDPRAPKVTRAMARNKSAQTNLVIRGRRLKDASVELVPTDRPNTGLVSKGKRIKATLDPANCVPSGSFVNVTTSQGTRARRVKVKGSCSNTP